MDLRVDHGSSRTQSNVQTNLASASPLTSASLTAADRPAGPTLLQCAPSCWEQMRSGTTLAREVKLLWKRTTSPLPPPLSKEPGGVGCAVRGIDGPKLSVGQGCDHCAPADANAASTRQRSGPWFISFGKPSMRLRRKHALMCDRGCRAAGVHAARRRHR